MDIIHNYSLCDKLFLMSRFRGFPLIRKRRLKMMGNPKAYSEISLEIATQKIVLESEYRFYIQNNIIRETRCNFKEAQIITEKLLDKLVSFPFLNEVGRIKNHIHNLITLEAKQLKSSMSKNFGLTESQFYFLVKKLQSGDQELFKETFLLHFDDCTKYLINKYRSNYDDAYDITMDTLIMFHTRLVKGKVKYGNIRFLFTQMASQHFQRKIKQIRNVDPMDIELPVAEEAIDEESVLILNKAWELLGENCQDLLKKVFYGQMKLKDIAIEEQKSSVAIRKQKERCVSKLKNLFLKITKDY